MEENKKGAATTRLGSTASSVNSDIGMHSKMSSAILVHVVDDDEAVRDIQQLDRRVGEHVDNARCVWREARGLWHFRQTVPR